LYFLNIFDSQNKTVFDTDNTKKSLFSNKLLHIQISEGSCDTENC